MKGMKGRTLGSLFCGIGGLDLGFERAGFEIAWQVEIDPYCQRILKHHWPEVPKYGDIKCCGRHNLEKVDAVVGGFPCQPYSVAGPRKKEKDPRWLWPEMLRIVGELLPGWVVAENPPGIAPALERIKNDLENLGYEVLVLEIPAAAFGAKHWRYRIFVIAHLVRTRCKNSEGSTGSTLSQGRAQSLAHSSETSWSNGWPPEPNMGRVVYGVSRRVGGFTRRRVASLGNAVVPAVAEWLGNAIRGC